MKNKKTHHLIIEKKHILLLILILLCIFFITLLSWIIIKPMFELAATPKAFRKYIAKQKIIGTLLFISVLILQVIAAVIPGGPFEIAAGYTYGPIRGAIICNIGMTIGSFISYLCVKKFGKSIIQIFFSSEKIDKFEKLKSEKETKLTEMFFIIFLIPGSPKDLLSYCAGLTKITPLKWILLCFICRTPAILLSTYSGGSLYNKNYTQFILLFVITIALSIIGSIIYKKITETKNN